MSEPVGEDPPREETSERGFALVQSAGHARDQRGLDAAQDAADVGDLLGVTDTQGHVTSAQYDTLGRVVSVDSPDAGRTEWRYDLAGNVREQQTARLRALGQRVTYQYDFNRLHRVVYPISVARVYEYVDSRALAPRGW